MKLPPYGKVLYDLQCAGMTPKNDIYLFIGKNAWQKAKAFDVMRPGTLCLPPYESPFYYDWPVTGCDILIFDTGLCQQEYIDSIVQCLFVSGSNIVRYVSPEFLLTVFKKDF